MALKKSTIYEQAPRAWQKADVDYIVRDGKVGVDKGQGRSSWMAAVTDKAYKAIEAKEGMENSA